MSLKSAREEVSILLSDLARIGHQKLPSREVRNYMRDIRHLTSTYPDVGENWDSRVWTEFLEIGQSLALPENTVCAGRRERFCVCCRKLVARTV